jgi:ribose 5-phosphate isomerase A
MGPSNSNDHKRTAAVRAALELEDGMVVGLGSGSTAAFAIEAIAARIKNGLRVTGIPTSEKAAALARQCGVPLTDCSQHRHIDVTIDGADEVERGTLNLIKGLGGALLREKIVAAASDRLVVVVDESKLVDCLGTRTPLPIEIVSWGWQTVLDHLADAGLEAKLRYAGNVGVPFLTDSGNYVADCLTERISDAGDLERRVAALVGVVDSGLFLGLASKVIVGSASGTTVFERAESATP